MALSFLLLTLVSFAYSQTSRKMIAKTILKIEIRVKFVKIRGICWRFPLEMQVQKRLLREKEIRIEIRIPEIGVFVSLVLSNRGCTCICNGFDQQIPRIFTNLTRISILKIDSKTVFQGGFSGSVFKEVKALYFFMRPHCRSLLSSSWFSNYGTRTASSKFLLSVLLLAAAASHFPDPRTG